MKKYILLSFSILTFIFALSCASNTNENESEPESKPDYDEEVRSTKYNMTTFSDDMETLYESLAEVMPSEEARKLYVSATEDMHNGDLDIAIQKMRDADLIEPENKVILKDLGLIYDQKGDIDSAKYFLGKCLIAAPTYSAALSSYGLMLFYQDSLDLAINYHNKALEYASGTAYYYTYYYNIAIAYQAMQVADSTCKYYSLCLEYCPISWSELIQERLEDNGCID